jgi:hypothetical protein
MNVNRSQGPLPHRSREYRESVEDFVKRTRNRLQHVKEHLAERLANKRQSEAPQGPPNTGDVEQPNTSGGLPLQQRKGKDTIDIQGSLQAEVREPAAEIDEPNTGGNEKVHRPKIARLKHAYRMGHLFKPEMLERAAHHMLRRLENANDEPNVEAPSGLTGRFSESITFKPMFTPPSGPNTESGPTLKGVQSISYAPYGFGGPTGEDDGPNTESGPTSGGIQSISYAPDLGQSAAPDAGSGPTSGGIQSISYTPDVG